MMEGLCSKFQQIRRNFCHFEIFGLKKQFFRSMGSVSAHSLLIVTLVGEKTYIFWFLMVSYTRSVISEAFHQVLDDQNA